jgi:hypothetical protein
MSKRGHKQPEFDNQSHFNLFSESPAEDILKEQQKQQPDKPAFLPPGSVEPLIQEIEKEANEQWERLDAQGIYTTGQIRQKIASEIGPIILSAEDIEKKEVNETIKSRAAKSSGSKNPKKNRRHLGPRQQNIADGDARVKTEYELLGQDPSPQKKDNNRR